MSTLKWVVEGVAEGGKVMLACLLISRVHSKLSEWVVC